MILTNYIGIFILLINTVLFIRSSTEFKTRSFRFFTVYMCCMLVVDSAVCILNLLGEDNLYLSHVYFLLQFILLSLFYSEVLLNVQLKRGIRIIALIIPLVVLLQYFLDYQKLFLFNIPEVLLCSLSLVLYSVFFLYQSLEERNKQWLFFSSGLLVYLLSSSIVFAGGNFILEKFLGRGYMAKLWIVNNLIYILYQVLITIEWYKNFRNNTLQKS